MDNKIKILMDINLKKIRSGGIKIMPDYIEYYYFLTDNPYDNSIILVHKSPSLGLNKTLSDLEIKFKKESEFHQLKISNGDSKQIFCGYDNIKDLENKYMKLVRLSKQKYYNYWFLFTDNYRNNILNIKYQSQLECDYCYKKQHWDWHIYECTNCITSVICIDCFKPGIKCKNCYSNQYISHDKQIRLCDDCNSEYLNRYYICKNCKTFDYCQKCFIKNNKTCFKCNSNDFIYNKMKYLTI